MHYCLSAIQILTLNAVFYMATLCWVGKRRGRKTKSLVIPREENWCINSSTPSNPPSHVMFPEARQGNLSLQPQPGSGRWDQAAISLQ